MYIEDLDEFCAALSVTPPKAGIIRQAVRELIDRELEASPELRRRFDAIKAQRRQAFERGLRVVK